MPYTKYDTSHSEQRPPTMMAVGGLTLMILVAACLWPTKNPYENRNPLPEPSMARARAPSVAAPADAARNPEPPRLIYRHSVISGGVHSAVELAAALRHDPVARVHYADFNVAAARVLRVEQSRLVHVSYRIGDKIYWTRNKVRLAAGENLLSDGQHLARARCGNRIADLPQGPVSAHEPAPEVLDAVFVSTESMMDQLADTPVLNGGLSLAPVAGAVTPAQAPNRFAATMQSVTPVAAIALAPVWNGRSPVLSAPTPRGETIAPVPVAGDRPVPDAGGIKAEVTEPVPEVIVAPEVMVSTSPFIPASAKPGAVQPDGMTSAPPATAESSAPPAQPSAAVPRTPAALDPRTPSMPKPEAPPPDMPTLAPVPEKSPATATAPISTPVPEPGSAALTGFALIALMLARRRRTRTAAP